MLDKIPLSYISSIPSTFAARAPTRARPFPRARLRVWRDPNPPLDAIASRRLAIASLAHAPGSGQLYQQSPKACHSARPPSNCTAPRGRFQHFSARAPFVIAKSVPRSHRSPFRARASLIRPRRCVRRIRHFAASHSHSSFAFERARRTHGKRHGARDASNRDRDDIVVARRRSTSSVGRPSETDLPDRPTETDLPDRPTVRLPQRVRRLMAFARAPTRVVRPFVVARTRDAYNHTLTTSPGAFYAFYAITRVATPSTTTTGRRCRPSTRRRQFA